MKPPALIAIAALFALSGPAVAQNTSAVQSALAILGYDPGPVDGLWGGQTRVALGEFYADRGGQFSGNLSRADHAALSEALEEHVAASKPPAAPQKFFYRYDFEADIEVWFPSQYAFTDGADQPGSRAFPFAVLQPHVHDFNGDSCDDILVQFMDSYAHPYIIYGRPDADGTEFVANLATDLPKTRSIRNSAIRDIDGDGNPDFVGFTAPHGLDGTGYVPRAEQEMIIPQGGEARLSGAATSSHGGLIGDVNGDGIVDIFPIAENPGSGRTALLGDGSANFTEQYRIDALSGDVIFDAQSADLNGDGIDDFVFTVAMDYSRNPQVTPARASEHGTLAIAYGQQGTSLNDLEIIRLGDHIMDEAQWTAYQLQTAYAGLDDPGYANSGTYSAPSNLDLIDFDEDGDLDVLVGYFVSIRSSWKTSGFRLFRNDDGQFSDVTDEMAPHQPANLFPGNRQGDEIQNQATDALMGASMIDLSGDGVKDLLLSVQTPDVMHHEGFRAMGYINVDGVFQPVVSEDDAFRYTAHMAAGDFNCDGADDIAGDGFHTENQHSMRIILGKR